MIQELLKPGIRNAITARELADILRVNKRTVYKHIHNERAAGALIIGCNDGFYIAEDRSDLEAFARRSHRRGVNTISAGTHARQELKKTEGQGVLFPTTDTTRQAPDTITDKP